MTRRAARISQDEVCRMVKAVRSCGLVVGRVEFDGERVSVVIGDAASLAASKPVDQRAPEEFDSLDEYLAWRDRECAS